MKKTLFVICFFTTLYSTIAQIVSIPDPNFKNALVNSPVIDTDDDGFADIDADLNDNGEIEVSEAESATNLYVASRGIVSLEGVESFSNIELIHAFANDIVECDLSMNAQLKEIEIWSNQLTILNVSGLQFLETLICNQNQIGSLDVTQSPNLGDLNCYQNQLTTIDLTQNPNLWLFWAWDNNLNSIQLNNPNLITLSVFNNDLTNIDVSNSTILEGLSITDNQIEELNVSMIPTLERVFAAGNVLENLDLSTNPNLDRVFCNDNNLTSLSVKNGNNDILLNFESFNNPNLLCIEVDDAVAAAANTEWIKDDTASYSENCKLNSAEAELNSIDIYPNPMVDKLYFNSTIALQRLHIYDTRGVLIKKLNIESQNMVSIDFLTPGVYFIDFIGNDTHTFKKVVKE